MEQVKINAEEMNQLLETELEKVRLANAEVFSEEWLTKVLTNLDTKEWPDVKEHTDNQFGQFIATAFKASEQIRDVCMNRFEQFLNNHGSTPEETLQAYVQTMALCEYASYLAGVTFQNALNSLQNSIEAMVKTVTPKEDPNVELN